MIAAARPRLLLPRPTILWVIAGSWLLALLAQTTGYGAKLHHGTLIEGTLPVWAGLVIFLVAWQAHIAAMMLPSSLPLIRLFNRASSSQPNASQANAAFLGGYAVVWTAFGALAFTGDIVVHGMVGRWAWLNAHQNLIGGSVLLIAGGFQFTDLKNACLNECRHPAVFLTRYYRRGVSEAFQIGRRHGLFCLGCCWALMLVMFAAGVANVLWMAPFALLMVWEKTGPAGDRGAAPIGVGLLALSVLVFISPAWLPNLFSA